MSKELAFALINPYTIAKSRTGGAIGRLMSRTGLDLVGARMFGPSRELVERYADSIRNDKDLDVIERQLLSDYVLGAFMRFPSTVPRYSTLHADYAVSKHILLVGGVWNSRL